jgi:hypothetical protein
VGLDAVLGQTWLIQHEVVLEMGSGRIIVTDGARKHYLNFISKQLKETLYNRTLPAVIGQEVTYPFHEPDINTGPGGDLIVHNSEGQDIRLFYFLTNNTEAINKMESEATMEISEITKK